MAVHGSILALTLSLTATGWGQTTWHVDDDAPAGGNGTSWSTAFRFLQDAMVRLESGDTVRVAQGVYRPDRDEENPKGTGDRFARFVVGVESSLLGGYAGLGAKDPDARDIAAYETILSGDLAGDDNGDPDRMKDNSEWIVRLSRRFVLCEGFTITAVNGREAMAVTCDYVTVRSCLFTGNVALYGPALEACDAGSHGLIVGCVFIDNRAELGGGAVSTDEVAPEFRDCLFINNSAAFGGAMYIGEDSTATLSRCTFIGNEARDFSGGAIYESLVALTTGIYGGISDSLFIGNRAATVGGAIGESNGATRVDNSVFIGNSAGERGGAIAQERGLVELTNCTLVDNTAGISGGALRNTIGSATIVNSILWRNEPGEISDPGAGTTVKFSDIRGGWSGPGRNNIAANPRYVRTPDPGSDGAWGTEDDDIGDLGLADDSPCIDAGKNSSVPGNVGVDLAGSARFVDVPGVPDTGEGDAPIVDMGAYEHQVLACARCTADLNCDDAVTSDDLCLWHRTPCDVDGDGRTDANDAAMIAAGIEEAFDDCNANGIPDGCEGLPPTGGLAPPETIDAATAPAVAIGDDLAIVGAHLDDEAGTDAGAVFVFQRDGSAWSPLYKLRSPEGEPDAQFGRSVALEDGVAVVGAHRDDENGSNAGAAFVYRHRPFRLVAEGKLLADDGTNGDNLGRAVAAGANLVIAGAHRDDDRGAAYVFRRDGGVWTQEAKLVASDRGPGDRFGFGVAIDGTLAIVGADRNDENGENAGAAYVFRFDGATWSEEQKLLAPDGEAGDGLGEAVAIDGNVAAVGAYGDDDVATNAGAVWVFRYDADLDAWIADEKLTAPAGADGDWYGRAVALRGRKLLVGSRFHDGGGESAGAAYLYLLDPTEDAWRLAARHDGRPGATLGGAVGLGAGLAIASSSSDPDHEAQLYSAVGAPDLNDNGVPDDCECPGDLDGDGVVRFDDLVLLLAAWGPCPPPCPEDLDGDELVGFDDLVLLLAAWGPCP